MRIYDKNIQQKSISINGQQFFYLECQQLTDICIVFLHGWLNSSLIYKQVMLELSDFKSIAVDLPGFGLSSPLIEDNTIENVTKELFKFTQGLNLKKIILVGASYSSLIALHFVAKYPKFVSGIIFQTLPYRVNKSLTRLQKFLINCSKIKVLFWLIGLYFKSPIYIYLYKNVYCKDIKKVKDEYLKEIINHSSRCICLQDAFESFRSILNADNITDYEIKVLKEKNIPYLLVLGEADNKFSIPELIDNRKIIFIRNGTHRLIVENPLEFSKIIREFIKSIKF